MINRDSKFSMLLHNQQDPTLYSLISTILRFRNYVLDMYKKDERIISIEWHFLKHETFI